MSTTTPRNTASPVKELQLNDAQRRIREEQIRQQEDMLDEQPRKHLFNPVKEQPSVTYRYTEPQAPANDQAHTREAQRKHPRLAELEARLADAALKEQQDNQAFAEREPELNHH